MPYKIPDSVAIMISANIGLMLYQIYVFNWFSVSSFIANVPVVYLVSITVPLGLAHFALFCIAGEIPVIETITSALSGMIVKINEFLSFGSGGFDMILSLIHISEPTRQAEISYAVFCLKKKKKKKKKNNTNY